MVCSRQWWGMILSLLKLVGTLQSQSELVHGGCNSVPDDGVLVAYPKKLATWADHLPHADGCLECQPLAVGGFWLRPGPPLRSISARHRISHWLLGLGHLQALEACSGHNAWVPIGCLHTVAIGYQCCCCYHCPGITDKQIFVSCPLLDQN